MKTSKEIVAPASFPISLEEYSVSKNIGDGWKAALAVDAGVKMRTIDEWDKAFDRLQKRPVVD